MNQESSQQNSSSKIEAGRWTQEEHLRFITGIIRFGKDWKKVQTIVKTRTGSQVRSHAQKYFLKLHKIQKEKRKQKNKSNYEPSETENQLIKFLSTEDISVNTPIEIINLIKKNEIDKSRSPKYLETLNLHSFIQIIEKQQHKVGQNIQTQKNSECSTEDLRSLQNKKLKLTSMKNLLAAFQSIHQDIEDHQQSFLIYLIKHNKEYFMNEHDIVDLIDFGKTTALNQTNGKRKRSFTLPQNEENQEILQERLQSIRKVIKTEVQTHQ